MDYVYGRAKRYSVSRSRLWHRGDKPLGHSPLAKASIQFQKRASYNLWLYPYLMHEFRSMDAV